MTNTADVPAQVAAVAIPWPEPDDENDHYYNHMLTETIRERMDLANGLRMAWQEGNDDPVLTQIVRVRREMLRQEETLRALLAYAREYINPRPYTLAALAEASGLSISGIRTAYGQDEVDFVKEQLKNADATL